jgi:signal transduction histidine kinase
LQFEDEPEAQRSLQKLESFKEIAEAHLYSTDKRLFVAYVREGEIRSEFEEIPDSYQGIREGWVHVFRPVMNGEDLYGTIYVRGSMEGLRQQKRDYLTSTLYVMLGMIVMAGIFAFLLQGFISQPILHLAHQAEHISAKADYSVRVEKPGNDEIGILYDCFNNMLAQIQMRQEELQRSNRDLDQFAYVASHDLKAPLRAISTLSIWLEEDLKGKLSAEGREQILLLRSRVQRMDALIDGVLRYSRVGRMETEGETVDVHELLEEQIEQLAPPAGFDVAISSAMPQVVTKRLRLSQVFSNLINNAIKYHDRENGRIEISARLLNPGGARQGVSGQEVGDSLVQDGGVQGQEIWEFAVVDDGPGIPPEHRERIFMMFQTLQSRDEVESTGLGLSLVKKLVEEEGGGVMAEETPGGGATFRFTWPATSAKDGPIQV